MGRVLHNLDKIERMILDNPKRTLRSLADEYGVHWSVFRYVNATRRCRPMRQNLSLILPGSVKGRTHPFCKRLFDIARDEGYGFIKLSEQSGIAVSTLSRYLRGQGRVDLRVIETLAETLGYRLILDGETEANRRLLHTKNGRGIRMWLSEEEAALIQEKRNERS